MSAKIYSNTSFDYIIVGQGIAGTFLSYYLYKAGKKVLVYDKSVPNSASKVATGIINPVTGRRIVKTWMIDTVMPFAVNAYREIGELLSIDIIHQRNILDFHPTPQMQQAFDERLPQEPDYLKKVEDIDYWRQYFNFPFGVGETDPCWLIDIKLLLSSWRNFLLQKEMLIEEEFDCTQTIAPDTNVIFAEGINGLENPYFSLLPYSKCKGEALLIEIENNLPRNRIYKNGIIMVPWKKEKQWWVGSSYEWYFTDTMPSQKFSMQKELQLRLILKHPFKIIDHLSSVRPTNLERRPFVGTHPIYNNIGIFNGMGTKGCSLSPYFADEFTQFLLYGKAINPLADVKRFEKVLSR